MRVCLDHAMGGAWHQQVRRPAVRHMSDDALARAVAVAERIVREPEALRALNRQSLMWRGKVTGDAGAGSREEGF